MTGVALAGDSREELHEDVRVCRRLAGLRIARVQMQDGGKSCDTPVEKNLALAKRFGARGTPAVYLADGRQVGGFLAADKLEEALNSVK